MRRVLKFGGAVAGTERFAEVVRSYVEQGPLCVVHGGGPQLDRAAAAAGLVSERVAGRRITSAAVRDLAIREWRGALNTACVQQLQARGVRAIGVCGADLGLLRAHRRAPVEVDGRRVDFGEVGDLDSVDAAALEGLLCLGVPVLAPLALGVHGMLNVNADTIAAAVAIAIHAEELVLIADVGGLRTDVSDPNSQLARVDLAELAKLEETGAIVGGMRPKITAVRAALHAGVPAVRLSDGSSGGTLFTRE